MEFEVLAVTRYAMNCSILWCPETHKAAVIDPGGDLSEILNIIELLELEPELALVTHGHFDHAGGAAEFARITGARIEGPHIGDAPAVSGLAEFAREHGFTGHSYVPARWLEHGNVVRFGNEELKVLHCPGHSAGHVAYYHEGRRQAFVGDILFKGTIGAWEHPGGHLPTLLGSIRNTLFPLGDDVEFVPGHGPTSSFGHERAHNPFVGDAAWVAWLERTADRTPS